MSGCSNNPCMFAQIDSAIVQMENVKKYLDDAFSAIQDATQAKVDEIIVNDINPRVNAKLAEIRASLLKSLQAQYQSFLSFSELLSPISTASPTDLSKVIQFCKDVQKFLVGAYATLMTFMTQLTSHLTRLTGAISSMVSYTPPISGISLDKLDIQMESISISDITGG